jgi:hypothetical protein
MSMRLVIEGTIIIIVPLIMLFLLNALSLLASVVYLTTCISAVDDIAQLVIVLMTPSAMLLGWSEAACRVPMGTLPVVKLVTLDSVFAVVDWVHHCCCVQHRLEAIDMRVDFFIFFG